MNQAYATCTRPAQPYSTGPPWPRTGPGCTATAPGTRLATALNRTALHTGLFCAWLTARAARRTLVACLTPGDNLNPVAGWDQDGGEAEGDRLEPRRT